MTYSTDSDLGRIVRAIHFAAQKHRDQRRKDSHVSPYINHPIALADVLVNEGGVTNPDVICAAILHDTIEDTETTREELEATFGAEIAGIVAEVTDDKDLPKAARKQLQIDKASHKSERAKLVSLADKICNLRDIMENPPSDWSRQRKLEYFDWAKGVVEGLRGTHAELEEIFDNLQRHGRARLAQ